MIFRHFNNNNLLLLKCLKISVGCESANIKNKIFVVVKCLKIDVSCESTYIKNNKRRNHSGFYSLTLGHFSYIYVCLCVFQVSALKKIWYVRLALLLLLLFF